MPNLIREEKEVYLKRVKDLVPIYERWNKIVKEFPWTFLHFTKSGTEKLGSAVSEKIIYKILMK